MRITGVEWDKRDGTAVAYVEGAGEFVDYQFALFYNDQIIKQGNFGMKSGFGKLEAIGEGNPGLINESGTYQAWFRLYDYQKFSDWDFAAGIYSEKWEYERTPQELSIPSNLRWNGNTAEWDAVEDEDLFGYEVQLYVDGESYGTFFV